MNVTLPETFVDYVETPREYTLSAITTVVDIHTRVSDLFSHPHDQIREQLRLTVEKVKERQESELINNADYGLLNNVDPAFKIQARQAAPTPDDLDELLSRIWKEPAFFLAHPRAIAAFGRECTLPRCSSAHGDHLRLAIPDLARHSADSHRQDEY